MDTTPGTTDAVTAASLIDQVLTLTSTRVVTTITPTIAAHLLGTVDLDVSRRLTGHQVDQLAVAMRDGHFDQAANMMDPLTIAAGGNLRNGKQRLVALILSGTTHTFTLTHHTDSQDAAVLHAVIQGDEDRARALLRGFSGTELASLHHQTGELNALVAAEHAQRGPHGPADRLGDTP